MPRSSRPGFRVLVEADGRRFDVRVAGTAGRICYRRKPRTDTPADDGTRPRELGEAARQDLALRLGVPLETVTVTGLRRLKPGDTLPGCGEVCAGMRRRLSAAWRCSSAPAIGL